MMHPTVPFNPPKNNSTTSKKAIFNTKNISLASKNLCKLKKLIKPLPSGSPTEAARSQILIIQ